MRARALAPWLLLALGLALLLTGVLRGEPAELLYKSANICLECIGVG